MLRPHTIAPADSAGEPIFPDQPPLADDGTIVDLDAAPTEEMVDGILTTEQPDGGVAIDFAPPMINRGAPVPFTANLAEHMSPADMDELGSHIVDAVADDLKSREEWEGELAEGMKYLGLKYEERTIPFKGACGVFDPLLAEAVVRSQAIARGELLPAGGPVKTQVIGSGGPKLSQQAARVEAFMNLYLTELSPEYYPDFDRMLFWWALAGSMFKKVYQDPILGRPVAPYLTEKEFVVAYTTSSLDNCPRATQMTMMSRRDAKQHQLRGIWLDMDLGMPQEMPGESAERAVSQEIDIIQGTRPTLHLGDERYKIYESHVDIDLKGFEHKDESERTTGLPLPYRVTIEAQTRKVLAVYRNWRGGDPSTRKRQCFVHYEFIPGMGFYAYGYAHLLGGSARAATMLRRQIIDQGTLHNFPGGLRVKGMRMEDNNLGIGPTEFREIDTGGLPIQQAVMPMPYREPSMVPLELLRETYTGAKNLANTAEIAVGEGRQDAPVGTTVALLEAANKVQSAILKRGHVALRQELKLFAELFGEYLPEEPYPFPVPGGQSAIMKADFSPHVDVIPVSDPNITSSAQRMMRAEALKRNAMEAPQIHNVREAYAAVYTEMGLPAERIARLLPEPQQAMPLDPLTENQNALMNMPLRAGPAQDHEAHIQAHSPLAELPQMQAHIAEHIAMKMRVDVERVLGMQLPPPGTPLPPQVENQIAVLVSVAMQQIKIEQEMKNPTPEQIMAMDVRVKEMKAVNDARIADAKTALDKYKIDMQSRDKALDRQSRERMNLIDAASGASDNQTPPIPYIAGVLKLGLGRQQ
jgi:hypothetical protein